MLKDAVGLIHGKLIFDRRSRVLADKISRLLPAHASVLDVGTGDGRIAKLCRDARADVSVEGIDVIVRETTHVSVRVFDGRTIPYVDKSVDVITFVDVLHHARDARRLLVEATRVARQGIIIKDHLAESRFDHAVLRLMDWVGNAPHGVALPYNYFSMRQWHELWAETGLVIRSFATAVPLYRPPLNLLFGRNLHFVADLQPRGRQV